MVNLKSWPVSYILHAHAHEADVAIICSGCLALRGKASVIFTNCLCLDSVTEEA